MTRNELRIYEMEEAPTWLDRLRPLGLAVGLVGAVVLVAGAFLTGFDRFLQSYLFAYLFWLELGLGSLAIVLLHSLVGGGWGIAIRRVLEAGAMTLWLLALLFVPLAIGLQHLYLWARPEVVAADPLLQHKSLYLNVPFFILRAGLYFAVWIFLAWRLTSWSRQIEYHHEVTPRRRFQRFSAFGLILYWLTVSFAATDWIMSLEPHWYSSIYGMLIIVGQVLGGLAFGIALTPLLARDPPLDRFMNPGLYRDLGAMLLAVVMIWAYIAFSQLLIIWSGNLPSEVTWYLHRSQGGWLWVGLLVFAIQFVLPFLLLLSLWAKRDARVLASLGAAILAMRLVDYFWHVMPAFHPAGFTLHWLDLIAPLAIGGLWVAAFSWRLKRTPLLLPVVTEAGEGIERGGEQPAA
jgi:hypothetical protein